MDVACERVGTRSRVHSLDGRVRRECDEEAGEALRDVPLAPTIVNGVWTNHRSDERTNAAYISWLKQNLSQ